LTTCEEKAEVASLHAYVIYLALVFAMY
jgi:hypothetical protein